jgi:nicotinate-nucleotide adenylyltransferase
MTNPMNIALFGTSADPPTIGHAAILEALADRFDHVAVWASDNPFKTDQPPLDLRNQMLGLLIQELQLPRVALHSELSHPRTWTTLEQAKTLWPAATFTLVVGADILPQLPRWYRAEELLKQLQVLVIPRSGYPIQSQDLAQLQTLAMQVEIAPITPPKVSSSEYRETDDRPENFLTPSIRDYIARSRLYQSPVLL